MSEEINKNDEAIETKLDLTDNKELEDNKEPNAPVITMKGLSGKKIASVVKVVKIKKKAKTSKAADSEAETEAKTSAVSAAKDLLNNTADAVKSAVKQGVDALAKVTGVSDKLHSESKAKVETTDAPAETSSKAELPTTPASVSEAALEKVSEPEQTAMPEPEKQESATDEVNVQTEAPASETKVETKEEATKVAPESVKAEVETETKAEPKVEANGKKAKESKENIKAKSEHKASKKPHKQVVAQSVLDSVNVTLPTKLGKIDDFNRDVINRVREEREKERRSVASQKAAQMTKAMASMRLQKLESKRQEEKAKNAQAEPKAQTGETVESLASVGFVVPKPIGKVQLPVKRQANSQSANRPNFNRQGRNNSTRNERPNQGGGSFSNRSDFGGFADKDKDDERKLVSHSRKQKISSVDSELTELLGKEAQRRNFQSRDMHKKRNDNDEKTKRSKLTNRNERMRGRISEFDEDDDNERRRGKRKNQANTLKEAANAQVTHVSLPEQLTVKEFAEAIKKTASEVIMKLMAYGVMVNMNQDIDYDTAATIADEFGITCDKLVEVTAEDILFDDSEDVEENLVERPPVVVVMGHVDHGKTTLLDHVRNTRVALGEAGGITQHIGAYTVSLKGRRITFLDTPGHEAFTTMRARGAQATDIAILVVAADDGVMPQTVEAINHAKAAKTEIIVAINKIDKPGANPERVKQELANYDLICEEWGGSTIMVPISAKNGENIDQLLEMVLLTADLLELKADPKRQAKGIVLEASLDKNRGVVASLLVQRGTLKKGDTIVTGSIVGNIRAMIDSRGKNINQAGPSTPVQIIGLPEIPEAGETFYQVKAEKLARQLADRRKETAREEQIRKNPKISLDALFNRLEEGKLQDLNIIVKGDVVGSVEAMNQSLLKLSNDEVKINIIHSQAGGITESDVRLAEVSDAIIIGFNVRPNNNVTDLAKELGVDIRLYRVIYNAIEDIEKAMKGLLAPTYEEKVLGHVEVRETFKISNVGTIAGAYVLDGKAQRNAKVRLLRDSKIIYEGQLASLKRFKDDVKEVSAGYECGLSIENYNDIKVGDTLELYEMAEVKEEE